MVTVTALFSYLNHRYVRLPPTIGLMVIALVVSGLLIGAGTVIPAVQRNAVQILAAIDFDRLVLHAMLGFLLFAGALVVDVNELRKHAIVIGVLATVGVVLSTVIVGVLTWLVLSSLGFPLSLLDGLLFGALISPTDPIAVLSILRTSGAPKDVEVQIAGESLFNDGVGVVVFLALLAFADPGPGLHPVGPARVLGLFLQEAIGGVALGLALGLAAYFLIKTVDNSRVEILLSLALVMGGYSLAEIVGVSAPIAIVVAGLLIGNPGRAFAMSQATRERLDVFWEVLDEILNGVLFVLIGLEILTLAVTPRHLAAGGVAVVIALAARWASTGLPLVLLRYRATEVKPSVTLMTWGGLRGGISIALALSLPHHATRLSPSTTEVIVIMTYVVVVFSVIVQGLTLGPLIRRVARPSGGA